MLSMPAATPTPAMPVRICAATVATACSDEAQALLTVYRLVVFSKPAWFMAMRPALLPPSSDSTTPTATSSMAEGGRFGFALSVAASTVESSCSGYASLSEPL